MRRARGFQIQKYGDQRVKNIMRNLFSVSLFLGLSLITIQLPVDARTTTSDDGFPAFFATFKKAVIQNDRNTIRNLMAPRFEWALDGYGSRDEALRNMDQMKLWRGLRNAVARKPFICKASFCHNRAGYHVWSSPRYRVEIMFERINGEWKWSALLGD